MGLILQLVPVQFEKFLCRQAGENIRKARTQKRHKHVNGNHGPAALGRKRLDNGPRAARECRRPAEAGHEAQEAQGAEVVRQPGAEGEEGAEDAGADVDGPAAEGLGEGPAEDGPEAEREAVERQREQRDDARDAELVHDGLGRGADDGCPG